MSMLFDLEDEIEETESIPQWLSLVKDKTYLGLDISKESAGIVIIHNGLRDCYNAKLKSYKNDSHSEVLQRRELAQDILEACGSTISFDAIVIEDVFEGDNPYTTRLLYALNTAIDELILDGKIKCSKFLRVNNQLWKSWLFSVDVYGETTGLKDKLKIEKCLGLLGVQEYGEGYQDRLDAIGMILGYLLVGDKVAFKKQKKRVQIQDVVFSYEEDPDLVKQEALLSMEDISVYITIIKRATKSVVLDLLSEHPESIVISDKPIRLGSFGAMLDMPLLEEGYLGFWVKPSARKKYMEEV